MKLTDYPQPSVTTDIIIFTIRNEQLQVLLVERGIKPFKGDWAIPGGFVHIDESLEEAARRELKEETGLSTGYLEQLYSFGETKRDPRGRVITIAYMALINSGNIKLKARTDVSDAQWFPIKKLPKLAFDHEKILDYALKRIYWKFEYTSVAFSMLLKKFTLTDLQKIYEIIFEKKFDKRNFRKKVLFLNILKEEGIDKSVSYRPPKLYSLKKDIKRIIEII